VRLGSVAKTKKPTIAGSVDTVAVAASAAAAAAAAATNETTSPVETITISTAAKRGSAAAAFQLIRVYEAVTAVRPSTVTIRGTRLWVARVILHLKCWSLEGVPEPQGLDLRFPATFDSFADQVCHYEQSRKGRLLIISSGFVLSLVSSTPVIIYFEAKERGMSQ